MASAFLYGSLGGLIAAGATTVGASIGLIRNPQTKAFTQKISLDFALGMMLSASAFSLLLPAGQAAFARGASSLFWVAVALALGAAFIFFIGRLISFSTNTVQARGVLFIIAMMLHNFPEGLASGAALGGLSIHGLGEAHGWSILGAIAIQNFPEGFATLLAFRALGMSMKVAFLGAFASAVVELVGGSTGGLMLQLTNGILPYLLAFAGGAMLFVSVREAIARFKEQVASARDLVIGTLAMTSMTIALAGLFN
ncbi:MAG TPA: ZIP family metal transporter [Bdellovibrionales bacterium]|nr:ZIP family metal transporter [Bdellovibrionales bacterium]